MADQRQQRVEEDAKRAQEIIKRLVSGKPEDLPKGSESMPVTELHQCCGLAFTFALKAGIGLTAEWGRGIVIAKLGREGAGAQDWAWSAPLFIRIRSGGIGLSFGYSEIHSVIVLDTPEALHSFAKTQVTLDTDVGAALGSKVASHMPITDANLSQFALTEKTFTYSLCEGVMADISLQGMGYTVDSAMNKALYGDAVTPQEIFAGFVDPPKALEGLYAELNKALANS